MALYSATLAFNHEANAIANCTESVVTPTFFFSGIPSTETTLAGPYTFNLFSYTPGCG